MIATHALRILAGNAVLAVGGWGFLLLTDAWRRLGRWSRLAVALLAGQALFLTVAPLLLYGGLSVSPVVVAPLVVAIAVAGLVAVRRRGAAPASTRAVDRSGVTASVAAALVVAPLGALALRAVLRPLFQIDTMLNWVMKAKVIWAGGYRLTGALDPRVFTRPDLHPQSHLEYPVGFSALLAWSFHWMGAADVRTVHLQLVLLVAAATGAAWAILRPIVADLPLAVGLSGLVMMPAVVTQLLTAYADVPLAFVWAVGALSLMRWASEGERWLLALATLLLAASLAVKQDGTFYVAAVYIGVAASLLIHRRGRPRELLASAGVVALTGVPWNAYTVGHSLTRNDIRPSVHRMRTQTGDLPPTFEGILHTLQRPGTFGAVLLCVALAFICLARNRRRTEATSFLISVAFVLVAIVLIYWNNAVTVRIVLVPALGRITMGLVVLAWLLVPPLAYAALTSRDEYDESPARGSTSDTRAPHAEPGS